MEGGKGKEGEKRKSNEEGQGYIQLLEGQKALLDATSKRNKVIITTNK